MVSFCRGGTDIQHMHLCTGNLRGTNRHEARAPMMRQRAIPSMFLGGEAASACPAARTDDSYIPSLPNERTGSGGSDERHRNTTVSRLSRQRATQRGVVAVLSICSSVLCFLAYVFGSAVLCRREKGGSLSTDGGIPPRRCLLLGKMMPSFSTSLRKQLETRSGPNRGPRAMQQNESRVAINIWIAKTIAISDVDETLTDIAHVPSRGYNATHSTSVRWILFCYDAETSVAATRALGRDDGGPHYAHRDSVTVVLGENGNKPYFWRRYLSDVPDSVDYIWLMDGDIVVRDMAWACFWNIAHEQLRPAIFQPSLVFPSGEGTGEKWYQMGIHPNSLCSSTTGVNEGVSSTNNLVAIETAFVEIQLPVFRADAWKVVSSNLNKNYKDLQTAWGPDLVWCAMADKELYNKTRGTLATRGGHNDWNRVTEECDVSPGTTPSTIISLSDRYHESEHYVDDPISCMIVHATPVLHRDTKTLVTKNYQNDDSKRKKAGRVAVTEFKRLWPDYFFGTGKTKDLRSKYWRSFVGTTSEKPCQPCKEWECSSLANTG